MAPDLEGLLEWLDTLDLGDQPALQERARLLLLDTVACAAAGLTKPEPAALAQRLAGMSNGTCGWPGHPARLGAADAAFVGVVAACWDEACEGLALAHGRPGLHAVPVAAALGCALPRSLGDVLTAIVRGYELGGRCGTAMRIRDGMHVDGTWGIFASVAAACSILRADRAITRHALAAAACQMPGSLYLPVSEGCSARNTYAAHAAATGVQLTAAAMAGINAPPGAFAECDNMLLAGQAGDWCAFDDRDRYYLLDGYLKPLAAARHVHYPAFCAFQWWQRHGSAAVKDIERVVLETYQEALTYCGNRAPTSPIQAQFSLSYGTAHALRTGTLGPDAYRPESLTDPVQRDLEARVKLTVGPDMGGRGARLAVQTRMGLERFQVAAIPGDPEQPMSSTDVRAKASAFLGPAVGAATSEKLIQFALEAPLDTPFQLPGCPASH